jgi:toxin ParE1/3/4
VRAVRWSATALTQFEAAIAYLAERNALAADHLADRLEETVAALAKRPIGRPGYRDGTYEKSVLKTPYLIVYSLFGGPDGELWIHRVFHTSQDWTGWTPHPDEDAQ